MTVTARARRVVRKETIVTEGVKGRAGKMREDAGTVSRELWWSRDLWKRRRRRRRLVILTVIQEINHLLRW